MLELLTPWWFTSLAVIGAIAIATAALNLFFALGRRPKRLWARRIPAVHDADSFLLMVAGAVNAPTRAGGSVEILNNGAEIFPAILAEIGRAERTITFFTYIFESGEIGDRVLCLLTERARAGVAVKLLLDGFGAVTIDRAKLHELEAAGASVAWYRPLRFGKLTRYHRRNHRRAIVIDGRIGFTGGASVADKWMGDARSADEWRDTMFRVSGPLALSLQATFSEAWSTSTGELLSGPEFYPFPDESADGGESISRHVNLISSPAADAHPIRKLFWISFMAARERIYLAHAYFVPDTHIRSALKNRAGAGVDVRILVPNRHTDAKPIWWASRSYYDDLLQHGVRIFEFQPTFLHSKILVVDGLWSVIGSANMDIRSKELNEENVLGILDDGFARALERTFSGDLERAREIRLDEWRRRGLLARALERFFVLFAEQY